MDIGELEKRITVLEDIEAIKKLKARYCAVCDDNHNPEKITTLFAPDGIWEGAGGRGASGARRDPQTVSGLPASDQLLAAQRDESRYPSRRESRQGHLVFPRAVHDAQWEPRGVARGALRRRLREAQRNVEVPASARNRHDVGALRKRLGQIANWAASQVRNTEKNSLRVDFSSHG